VSLHLYDISNGMARQFSQQLVGKYVEGIWHSGVVVYGKEYFWGGILQEGAPGNTPYGRPTKVVDLGETFIPNEVFQEYLGAVSDQYTLETYHLINFNCNNFSDECCKFLTGANIPEDVRSFAKELMNSPFGQMFAPYLQSYQTQIKEEINNSGGHWSLNSGNTMPIFSNPQTNQSTQTNQTNQRTQTNQNTNQNQRQQQQNETSNSPPTNIQQIHDEFVGQHIVSNPRPIIAAQSSIDPIVNKILTFKISEDEKITIENIRANIKQNMINFSSEKEISLIVKLSNSLSEKEAFAPLYLLRLFALDINSTSIILNRKNDIREILTKYLTLTTSGTTLLMTSLLSLNLFSTEEGKNFMLDYDTYCIVVPSIMNAFESGKTQDTVLENYAKILFNYSISLPKDTSNVIGTELLISICDYLFMVNLDPILDTIAIIVVQSLGHLLYKNIALVQLSYDLEYAPKIKLLTVNGKPKEAFEELKRLV